MFIAIAAAITLLISTIAALFVLAQAIRDISLVKKDLNMSTFAETVHKLLRAHRVKEALDFCDRNSDKFVYDQSADLIEIGGNRKELQEVLIHVEKGYNQLWPKAVKQFWVAIIKLAMISCLINMSLVFFTQTDEYLFIVIISIIANVIVFVFECLLILLVFIHEKNQFEEVMPYFKRLAQTLIFYEIPPTEDSEE